MVSVLFDANNLAMRNLFAPNVITLDPKDKTKVINVDYELWKYCMINSIYRAIYKISNVREVILAVDDKASWRKLYWTRYKSHRKLNREKIDLNWDEFYKEYELFMEEVRTHLPFKVIKVKQAEADDIIGVLCLHKDNEFHIISTDKDFLQLCSPKVTIYNPVKKQVVAHPNPEMFIVEQCLMGQAKDNIYNIKTPLTHDESKRKPGFGEAALDKVIIYGWERWLVDNNLVERYNFNRNLMDFRKIPPTIVNRVLKAYDEYKKSDIDNIMVFFNNHPWPEYTENFTNVENKLMEIY